jgi:pyruvyltransferase
MLGNLLRKPIRAYWWSKISNFGDALAPYLLQKFAYLDNIQYSDIANAQIASIGSILEHIPSGWDGFIVGSGLLRETSKLKFDPSRARILGLRGPLSAKGIPGSFALGDPGLLSNELVEYQEKEWDLGIVPHWQDDELVQRFTSLIPSKFSVRVILPCSDPLTVIREIAACRRIVTSSLHGMIVADSIGGIPRRVEYCKNLEKDGKDFKFKDYSSGIKCPFEFGTMYEARRNRIDDAKFEVYDAYRELGRLI